MEEVQDLSRFIQAQEAVYAQVLRELAAGRKTSHWMWFVFPQLRGLGHSAMATRFALASLAEARAYLAHPLLGARLKDCVRLVLRIRQRSSNAAAIEDIFGPPDDLKFHSCMTLFHCAAPQETLFKAALGAYFDGMQDPRTLELLDRTRPDSR